jgi:hypothetical protein
VTAIFWAWAGATASAARAKVKSGFMIGTR